ncbi:MAG: PP2C family protein-serine/threonine phosphatase [Planctomycetes bacterium]|nr:PP2C family protein-serine/threonine phosphatase [Planctomycetota bacterium]
MTPISAPTDRACATTLAELHAARSQDELERTLATALERRLGTTAAALCLADDIGGTLQLRLSLGDGCPVRGRQRVRAEDWQLPAERRLPVRFRSHLLGEFWLGRALDAGLLHEIEDLLVHYATALVNLTLNAESRQATEDYCASLQALEEGIVLFQEEDPAAVTARLLSLASSMVQATAGALYVLREVGKPDSGLRLEQALGIPDVLLQSFTGIDGCAWPDVLLDQPAHLAVRAAGADLDGADGSMAMLAPECVPPILQSLVVLPLRYHGVQAGVCLLFNPLLDASQPRDFLGRLQSFGQLAAALLHRLSLEALQASSVTIARELEIAETIQKRLLPERAPPTDEYEFAWSTIAAKNIGGDYLDLLTSDLGDIYLACADASGHGINSALLMSSFRANYRGNAAWQEPNELAALLNREVVHEVGPTGMFITAAMVRLERDTKRLSLCSAGHNPTLLWRAASQAIESFDSNGPPLGFVGGVEYEGAETTLASGDVVLLFTDGVTEATNAELDMFGEDRLKALLAQHANDGAERLLTAVRTALAEFTGRDRYDDDVSMLVVKVR